jgi:hypothetical protein
LALIASESNSGVVQRFVRYGQPKLNKNMKRKYATFTTTGDFEKWQDENPQAIIHQVTPIIGGLQMNQTTPEKMDATIAPCAVFVLYHESSSATSYATNHIDQGPN